MNKWFKTYVLSIRKDFLWLLFVDVTFLLIMELVLKKISAPYAIFVRIGDLFVTLGVSFLASFIFYFVQVHMHRIKEKEHVYPSIAMMFNAIICADKDILTQLLGIKMGCQGTGQWHSLKCLESGTVLFEAKDGPYHPLEEDEIWNG